MPEIAVEKWALLARESQLLSSTPRAPASGPKAVVDAGLIACKVCDGPSLLLGVVDFHKSCMEARGLRLALAGIPIYYRRCSQCGFAFTDALDGWSQEEFAARIYNRDYVQVDPDFFEARPDGNAQLVAESFALARESIRILDYRGGSGLLAMRLRDRGFSAETYDPFSEFYEKPKTKFDLITCFEVMEHVVNPRATVAAMISMLEEDGLILFSTLVQPENFDRVGLEWWYAAPRNGHVSLYSTGTLARLFGAHGLRVGSYSADLHVAYGRVPGFASHLGLP